MPDPLFPGAAAGTGGTIVFNCSNGHRIIVPAKMAGQRGKCSKCGVPVSIPNAGGRTEDAGSQSGSRDDLFAGLGDDSDSQVSVTEFLDTSTHIGDMRPDGIESEQGTEAVHGHPTATLVARLFQEREHGGIVEVHIAGGSVILPEFYEFRWSVGSHGLFASRAADGTVTLTAVAWDSIQKIIVRQIKGLPDGMFE